MPTFGLVLHWIGFLGPTFAFGDYSMTLIKHDEGDNARSFNLHREIWVLLVAYPEDLKNGVSVAKVVSGFGLLVYWHEIESAGAIVAKVYLNDTAKIPSSVKINAGLLETGRSWTAACFFLKLKITKTSAEEEGFVTMGPLQPVPPPAPRWNVPNLSRSTSSTPTSSVGSAMAAEQVGGSQGRWKQQLAPMDANPLDGNPKENLIISWNSDSDSVTPEQGQKLSAQDKGKRVAALNKFPVFSPMPTKLKFVIIGPSAPAVPFDPLVTIIPSLLKQELGDNAMEKIALECLETEGLEVEEDEPVKDQVAEEQDSDVDMEILERERSTSW